MVKKVKVRILPPIKSSMRKEVEIQLDEERSSIDAILSKLYEILEIQPQRYDEILNKSVHIFWTRLLIKNGETIGSFGIEGPDIKKNKDRNVEGGDDLVIMSPTGGG